MRLGQSRLWRRLGGALALCGVVLYATLIPGHLVSQTLQQLVQAELGAVEIDCHKETGTQAKLPAKPKKSCPFCAGFASFQLAALGATPDPAPPQAIACDRLALESQSAPSREAPTANSRAPPPSLS
jgi:hypothetical protein